MKKGNYRVEGLWIMERSERKEAWVEGLDLYDWSCDHCSQRLYSLAYDHICTFDPAFIWDDW